MRWLDLHDDVIQWSSESVVIPYISPKDNRMHRYFVDFYTKVKTKDGKIEESLIEVKPLKETRPPKVQKRKTRRYITEVMTWGVNQAKWKAASAYCKKRGWKWVIMTERGTQHWLEL